MMARTYGIIFLFFFEINGVRSLKCSGKTEIDGVDCPEIPGESAPRCYLESAWNQTTKKWDTTQEKFGCLDEELRTKYRLGAVAIAHGKEVVRINVGELEMQLCFCNWANCNFGVTQLCQEKVEIGIQAMILQTTTNEKTAGAGIDTGDGTEGNGTHTRIVSPPHCLKDHVELNHCVVTFQDELQQVHLHFWAFNATKQQLTKVCSFQQKYKTCLGEELFNKCTSVTEVVKDYNLVDRDQRLAFDENYRIMKEYRHLCGSGYKGALENFDCIKEHAKPLAEYDACVYKNGLVGNDCGPDDSACVCNNNEKKFAICFIVPLSQSCGVAAGDVACQEVVVIRDASDEIGEYLFPDAPLQAPCKLQCASANSSLSNN